MNEQILNYAIEYLTKMLIKQDFEDKKNKKVDKITISRVDYIRNGIDLLKLLKKSK